LKFIEVQVKIWGWRKKCPWFPSGIIHDFHFLDMPPISGEKLSNQRMLSGIVVTKILSEAQAQIAP